MKAWLEGHQIDLEDLADLLPSGDVRVVKEGDRYYLTSPEIDDPPAGKQSYEVAPAVLTRVNGLGRAHSASFRPVKLVNTYQEGDHQHHVALADTIEVRAKVYAAGVVTSGDGTPTQQPPPPGPQHAAVQDANVAEALAIMGQPTPLGWVELYKVFEIVEAAGAVPSARQAAGLTRAQVELFGHTAQQGRHARGHQPPKNPMPIEQARELVSRLVRAWLDAHVAGKASP